MKQAREIDLFDKELLQEIQGKYFKLKQSELVGLRENSPKMKHLNQLIEHHYLLNKLRIYCRYLAYQAYLNKVQIDLNDEDFALLRQHIEHNKNLVLSSPALYLYYQVSETIQLDYENEQLSLKVNNCIKNIQINRQDVSQSDQIDLLSFLSNFVTKGINLNHYALSSFVFRLNIEMIGLKFWEKNNDGVLPLGIFKNTLVAAITYWKDIEWKDIRLDNLPIVLDRNSMFEWAKEFVKQYSKFLKSNEKDAYVKYCMAFYLFWYEDFEDALAKLDSIKGSKRDFIQLGIKKLTLKCLFHLEKEIYGKMSRKRYDTENRIKAVSDSYRKQLQYFETDRPQLSYQLKSHSLFRVEFNKMYNFHKTYDGVYKGSDSSFKKKQEELSNHLNAINYPFTKWIRTQIVRIK